MTFRAFKGRITCQRTILYFVNDIDFFLSHRLEVGLAAKKHGYNVGVIGPYSASSETLKDFGFAYYQLSFSRKGHNIASEIFIIIRLILLIMRVRPCLLHLVTIKPVLYGGLAGYLFPKLKIVFAISGMGVVFSSTGYLASLRRLLVSTLYSIIFLRGKTHTIVQNEEDYDYVSSKKFVDPARISIIKGSGVSLDEFFYVPENTRKRPIVVTMAARLLKSKGVPEFVKAAELLSCKGLSLEMRVIGDLDPNNSTSVSQKELNLWREQGIVNLLGYRKDMHTEYADSNIVCLPSHREGSPKALAEAAATGRCIVTTDVPGCRDAIIPGVTGVLVPPNDPVLLAKAIETLAQNDKERLLMGIEARKFAVKNFDVMRVADKHIKIYANLLQE